MKTEEKFRRNQLKVTVATIYQQIGRAGRNIDRAYIFLMYGEEDEDILNYFPVRLFLRSRRHTSSWIILAGTMA